VRERTNGALRLGTGTLYTALRRLLEQGWIVEVETPGAQELVGAERSRRTYSLTKHGEEGARAEARRLEKTVAVARSRRLLETTGRAPRR
jgi:DNA-binding PadR family transcriptional regulator